jgi:hypothetical protein
VDTAEHHAALRESVGRLVGPDLVVAYYQEVVAAGEAPDSAVERAGRMPASWVLISPRPTVVVAGGWPISTSLSRRPRPRAALLLFLVIQSICAPILERYATQAIKDEWLPALAAGKKEDGVRHYRAQCRIQHAQGYHYGEIHRT